MAMRGASEDPSLEEREREPGDARGNGRNNGDGNGNGPAINAVTAAVVLLTIATLYFGRDIFIPFALAVLLSFLLARPVDWLRRLRMPRVAAVVVVVSFAVIIVGAISALVGSQLVNLADNLPAYQQTMQHKIRALRGAVPGGATLDRTTEMIQELGRELSGTADATAGQGTAGKKQKREPVPVRIDESDAEPMATARNVIAPLLAPLGTAGLVIVFIFFVLLDPSNLRDRFIRLAGSDLHRTTEALSEAADRVSRYLLMQLVVNATYGAPLGIGLYLIGIPSAFLWGLLATLLRFVPYLGPVIAAMFPLTLAFAVDPGWSTLLWTAALVICIELFSNNVVEPWLYGSSTGMTPVAVIVSAIFWTLLWGPVGLILATPLTVCLVVMGRYVPQLSFLDVLLGSEPVLLPEERLYQRLLAENVEEAMEIAEAAVAEEALLPFYDGIALPALRLAENAREHGASREDRRKVALGMRAVVQDLKELAEQGKENNGQWLGTPVLCVAGRSDLDFAAGHMLAHALEENAVGASLVPPVAVTHDRIGDLDLAGVEAVCLIYFNSRPEAYARFVCRRLKRRLPHLKIALCLWNLSEDAGSPEQVATEAGADAAPAGMRDAVNFIKEAIGKGEALPSALPPQPPAAERSRLEALQASGILDVGWRPTLDRVARRVAEACDTPIGLVSLIDDNCQLWRGAVGLPEDLEEKRQGTRDTSICAHVVAANAPLVVEDTARDRRFAGNPFLRERGLRFYAGVPLRTADGQPIGSLCVIDKKPRALSARDLKLLQIIADELMAEVSASREGSAVGTTEAAS